MDVVILVFQKFIKIELNAALAAALYRNNMVLELVCGK